MKMRILTILAAFAALASAAAAQTFQYDSKGRRDPFTPPVESGKPITDAEITGKLTELKGIEVQGIIWDEKNPMAMIEDEIITEGQNFRGAKVVDIQEHAVVMEFKGEMVTIRVKEEEEAPAPQPAKSKKEIKTRKGKGKTE